MKAILKYPGGKWRIANWIISHFPEHKVYLEPYFGSGAIFFNKKAVQIETINDLNGDIVNLFKTCRDMPNELSNQIRLTPFSREEYCDCYERSEDVLEQARRTLVRYWQSFGTSNANKYSWKNSQTANSPNNPYQWNQLPEIIQVITNRLKEAQIENVNAIELIKRYNDENTLIYCDPPYIQSTRKKNLYKCEMSDAEHLELLKVLKESKSKIILSAYDNDLYNEELKDWSMAEIDTIAQMGLKRKEKIYMNFKPVKQHSMFEIANWRNGMDFPSGWRERCNRTDKWIKSQNADELYYKYLELDAKCLKS